MNRGSIWRKWNFHVHTKGTNKNDQFKSPTMDDFWYTFYKKAYESNISAIGITDYFSIEKYLEAKTYKDCIDSKKSDNGNSLFTADEIEFIKSIFIFPNVELRMLPSTDKGRLINIHCLFNPDYVPRLEHDFFSSIKNQDDFNMSRYGMTEYGKHLDGSIINVNTQYRKGVENFVININSLKALISTNKNFKENTLIIVSNSNDDGASGTQKHYDLFENESGSLDGLRRSIYFISDAIFSNNPKDVKYFLGKKSEGKEYYNEETLKKDLEDVVKNTGSLKPCITGCDAHSEDKLFKKITWVKGDLNFEGLRQICFEPEQRVIIQDNIPDLKEDKLVIDNVRFICPNNNFPTKPIFLNPNLNMIIGGKSSGKSILLYLIAKTLLVNDKLLKNRDKIDKYKFEKGFDFEIETKGGFKQKFDRALSENSILPEIKYIPQNYLVKLAEPDENKTGRDLNQLVRELIAEDNISKGLYEDFISTVKQNDKLRNSQIDSYFQLEKEINTRCATPFI